MNDDEFWYLRFTGPQQVHKAMNVLYGILTGISCDAHANRHEVAAIRDWREEHAKLLAKQPFAEVDAYLTHALADGYLESDEIADLVYLCRQAEATSTYFDHATAQMQILHGLMKGIALDGEISKDELEGLRNWLAEHDDLSGVWPYAEVFGLISEVLRDGVIDQREHNQLLRFFGAFGGDGVERERVPGEVPVTLMAICEMGVDIEFPANAFCFTGGSARFRRRDLEDRIVARGGIISPGVTHSLRYLIVCDNGNKAWAFSAYGRKVEKAIALRKGGHRLSLVSELDLLDALVE